MSSEPEISSAPPAELQAVPKLQSHLRSTLLAIASGIVCGLLVRGGKSDLRYYLVPGTLFALVLLADSAVRRPRLGILESLGVVCASLIANWCAVELAMHINLGDLFNGTLAGLLGGTLLGLGIGLAYRLHPLKMAFGLGVTGAALGGIFFFLPHPSVSYAVWQGGVALVISLALSRWGRQSA